MESTSWPCVQAMAKAMEDKLAIRRFHGGRVKWIKTPMNDLVAGLYRELDELEGALAMGSTKDILWEAVDVANRAMMIADKAGLLEYDDELGD